MQYSLGKMIRVALLGSLVPWVVVGCNGSSSTALSGDPSGVEESTGTFSLSVTDAPVDSAAKVVVSFSGVALQPVDGEAIEFLFEEPRSIDLLQLQGTLSEALVNDAVVPAGAYEWLRLYVNAAQDGVLDSYLERDDGTQQELWIPSGDQSGLKLVNGFLVPAGGTADFTIDFDLRKSIVDPKGMPNAIMKPVLRIVDNVTVGSIEGSVSAELISAACVDPALEFGAVYVYNGLDVTPVDVQGAESDPMASALLHEEGGFYQFEVGFLPEGDYTIAYTCAADADDPLAVDALAFEQSANIAVVAELPSVFDFDIPVDTGSEEVPDDSAETADGSTEQ